MSPGVPEAPEAGAATTAASPRAVAAVVWRSLPLQAAFNPQTLQGAGFAHAVLPRLRRVHGPAAGPRAGALAAGFNANPYLATFAIGAVLSAEGVGPAQRTDRFLALVRGPLGALGDTLFWGAARPAVFVPAALAVAGGAPWWVALAALAPYNAIAFAARTSGARAGLARGLDVAAVLAGSWIRRAPPALRAAGAAAIGLAAGWLLAAAAGTGSGAGWLARPEPGSGGTWWAALAAFGAGTALLVVWPRRLGWGTALAAAWLLAAALARATA